MILSTLPRPCSPGSPPPGHTCRRGIGFVTSLVLLAGLACGAPEISVGPGTGTTFTNSVRGWGSNSANQSNVPVGLTGVTAIAAGTQFSMALRGDGTVLGWGRNDRGQTTVPAGLRDVSAISAGGDCALALTSEGRVFAWGSNFEGQTDLPLGLTGVSAIAAGGAHALALKNDGTVVAWGSNTSGQASVPPGLTGVTAIAAGVSHSVALRDDGTVVAWGLNTNKQVSVPDGLTSVTAIAAAERHTMALKSDGTVVAWGVGVSELTTVPPGLVGVTAIAAGWERNVALKSDGTVVTWGRDVSARTGPPAGLTGVTAVTAGSTHTLALQRSVDFGNQMLGVPSVEKTFTIDNTGTDPLGISSVGVIGDDGPDFSVDTTNLLTTVPALGETTSITVSFTPSARGVRTATLRIVSDDADQGTFDIPLTGWAPMFSGISVEQPAGTQLGSRVLAWGRLDVSDQPPDLTDVTAVAVGLYHTAAIRLNGSVVTWGFNTIGQTTVPDGLTSVMALAAGAEHTVALKSDGTVVAWSLLPTQTTLPVGLTGVTAIAAGAAHTAALKSDGSVVAWGENLNGRTSVPAGLTGVTAIAAGDAHTLALKADGTVVGWGANASGQRNPPADLTGVTAIAAGAYHSLALKSGGTVVAWGNNSSGQSNVPAGLSNVTGLAAGERHSVALKHDGSVVVWGGSFVPPGLMGVTAIAASGISANGFGPRTLALQRAVDYGHQLLSSTSLEKSFTIRNTGPTPLAIASVSVVGGNAADFSLNTDQMLGSVPALGGTTTFTVTFTPQAIRERSATLRIVSDDVDESRFDIALIGRGAAPPSVRSPTSAGVAETSATLGAEVTSDGGLVITERGIVYSESAANADPFIGGLSVTKVTAGGSTGLMTIDVTGLTPTTSYSFKAYATNGEGTSYTTPVSTFVTKTPAPEIAIEQGVGVPLGAHVVAWGSNVLEQTSVPDGLTDVMAIAANGTRSVALRSDGTVVAWGYTMAGQVNVPAGLAGVTAIATGESHSVALKENGTVVAWGYDGDGRATVPAGLAGVVAIAAGAAHTVALRSDGTVLAWGSDSRGQRTVPPGLSGVVGIAAGYAYTSVVKSDGTVVCWGENQSGQTTVPPGLAGVKRISAGDHHVVALRGDGKVVAWGDGFFGETTVPSWLTRVTTVAAGESHTLALQDDGNVVGWGSNFDGQLSPPTGLKGVTAIAAAVRHSVAMVGPFSARFEAQALATPGIPKSFTIRNTGLTPLLISTVTVSGGDAADFAVDTSGMLQDLPALDGSTTFAVTFTPGAAGARGTTLRVISNDSDEGTFDIALIGTGTPATPYELWSGSMSLTGAEALPEAIPHSDGVPNLLKYAFNMDGAGPDTTLLTSGTGTHGLPAVSLTGGGAAAVLRLEFLRRRNRPLLYTPQMSSTLDSFVPMTGAPTVTVIDAEWERVVIEEPLGDPVPPHVFSRVAVALE